MIGIAIDMKKKMCYFACDSDGWKSLAMPPSFAGRALFPVVSGRVSGAHLTFNFGDRPFAHGPPDDRPWALNV